MEQRVQAGDDLARLEVPHLVEAFLVEALEQHRGTVRVRTQQPDRSAPAPVLQRKVLMRALLVGKADLQNRGTSTGRAHWYDEGDEAMQHLAVAAQLPLLEETRQEGRQPLHPFGPVRSPARHAEDAVGKPGWSHVAMVPPTGAAG